VDQLVGEATVGARELEGPEKVGRLLKVRAAGEYFVHKVFHANNALATQDTLDDRVVGNGNALLVNLAKATLVNESLDSLQARVAICDVGFDQSKHSDGCLVQLDKDGVVDLAEAKELENLLGLGSSANDTSEANNNCHLGLGGDKDVSSGLGYTLRSKCQFTTFCLSPVRDGA